MKKNGFTLIELLGIIIILAVLALLFIPAVLGFIEDSRVSSAEASATLYVESVELASAQKKITDSHLDGVYLINNDGNLCPEADGVDCENPINIEMKGNKPTSGTIVLDKGYVEPNLEDDRTKRTLIHIDKYNISYNANNELRSGIICWLASGTPNTAGSKYTCHPGDKEYTFYYLVENGDVVSLIMDRNLGETEAFNVNEANTQLKSLTEGWTSLERKNITLPTADQLAQASGLNYHDPSRPVLERFVCDNLLDWYNYSATKDLPMGFWTSTECIAGDYYYMYTTHCRLGASTDPKYLFDVGVRPVINIYKEQIGV